MHRLRLIYGVTASLIFVAWLVAGLYMHGLVATRGNNAQLDDLTRQVLARVDRALDLVLIGQTELMVAGVNRCGPETEAQLRNVARSVATLYDLHLLDGVSACAAFSPMVAQRDVRFDTDTWRQSRNSRVRIGPIDDASGRRLGLLWAASRDLSWIAEIKAESVLFDVLPPALREDGLVSLRLDDDTRFAVFRGGREPADDSVVRFEAHSERYPISARVEIAASVFAGWRTEPSVEFSAALIAAGLLVALVCADAVTRRTDPEIDAVDRALLRGEIVAHFQPVVSLADGRITGVEALARWIDPSGADHPPSRFVAAIERAGRGDALLSAIIEDAGRRLGSTLASRADLQISINVSAPLFCAPDFAARFLARLERAGLRPEQVLVELTERQELEQPQAAAAAAAALTAVGVRLAIDDAGTGHNGLAAIQTLSADCLKIDKYFVDGLPANRRSRIMVDLLVGVAREFGMRTVAEGVETVEQADALRVAGVNAAQGFLFARALPADQLIEMLDRRDLVRDESAAA